MMTLEFSVNLNSTSTEGPGEKDANGINVVTYLKIRPKMSGDIDYK